MGILDDDVARVRDATDLVALAGEHLALKRVGKRFVGLCPFHAEKTPSFNVNPEMGRWYCFGCQANGDAISFVREVEHLDFVDAVERLARAAGITLRYDDKSVTKDKGRKARLNEAVAAAIVFYEQLLLESPEGGIARKYLRGRGFDGDAVRQFKLGWSPDGWDRASVHLQHQKFSRDRHRRRRSRVREQGEQAAGPVPRAPHVPDLRQQGRTGRLRRARARRRRPEVQELTRDLDLPEEPVALRAQLGQGRGRGPRADPHLRGLHRRDGVRALR